MNRKQRDESVWEFSFIICCCSWSSSISFLSGDDKYEKTSQASQGEMNSSTDLLAWVMLKSLLGQCPRNDAGLDVCPMNLGSGAAVALVASPGPGKAYEGGCAAGLRLWDPWEREGVPGGESQAAWTLPCHMWTQTPAPVAVWFQGRVPTDTDFPA